jgi:hypothetical protein
MVMAQPISQIEVRAHRLRVRALALSLVSEIIFGDAALIRVMCRQSGSHRDRSMRRTVINTMVLVRILVFIRVHQRIGVHNAIPSFWNGTLDV